MSTETIKFLIHPFTIFWVLLLASTFLFLLKKKRLFKWAFLLAIGWFFIISTPMVPKFLLTSLEDRYDPILIEDKMIDHNKEYHIVVLGAGYRNSSRYPNTSLLSSRTRGRLIEGIRLYQKLPNSKIITSGPHSFSGKPSQAEVVRNAAIDLGVRPERILVQSEPRTTFEEAKVYHEKHYDGQSVIIVTDAAHMPRAMYEFQKYINQPLASPANYSYSYKGMSYYEFSIIPRYEYIGQLEKAVFEHAAIFRNWVRD